MSHRSLRLPAITLCAIPLLGLALTGLSKGPERSPAVAQTSHALGFSDITDDGSIDLFEIGLDGNRRRPLLESPAASETDPAWAAAGWRLAFSAPAAEQDRGIFVLDAALDAIIAVTEGPVDLQPAWSPDSEWIAFARRTELDGVIQSSALALVRPNGADQRILTLVEGSARIIGRPSWSPDGQRIVFALRQEAGGGGDLYVIGRDGSGLTRLLGHPGWDDIDPAWSPDGRWIAFASGPFEVASARSRHEIWLYDLERDALGTVITDPSLDLRRPAWSPDGRQLALDAGPLGSLARQIHLLPAEGGRLGTALTTGFAPSWRAITDPPPTPTAISGSPVPTATDSSRPTPVSSSTPIVEPTLPALPTLVPFPTFPPPEPTEPGPAPTFPWPSATPTTSPSPTATPKASPTPEGPSPIYLPFLLRLHPDPTATSTPSDPGEPTPDASPTSTAPAEPTPTASG